jgi:hypothetical protein
MGEYFTRQEVRGFFDLFLIFAHNGDELVFYWSCFLLVTAVMGPYFLTLRNV